METVAESEVVEVFQYLVSGGVALARAVNLTLHKAVKPFHFFACPRGFTQKLQAGFNAGVDAETTQRNAFRQFRPTKMRHQRSEYRLQREAVQRIVALLEVVGHACSPYRGQGCDYGGYPLNLYTALKTAHH